MKELVVKLEQLQQEFAVEIMSLKMPDQLLCLVPELLEYPSSPENMAKDEKEEYIYADVSDENEVCDYLAIARCFALDKECLIVRRCFNKEESIDTIIQDYNTANINNHMGYLVLKVAKEHMQTVKNAINDFVSTHKWTRERYKWLGN